MNGIIGYIGHKYNEDNITKMIKILKQNGRDNVGIIVQNDSQDYAIAMEGRIKNKSALISYADNNIEINTDEELLLSMLYDGNQDNKLELLKTTSYDINGDITFAFISKNDNTIYAKKGNPPLLIGICQDGYYICSELIPMTNICKKYIPLPDNCFVKITKTKLTIFNKKGKKIKAQPKAMPKIDVLDNKTDDFDNLVNCPSKIKKLCDKYIENNKLLINDIKISQHVLDRINRIIITGDTEEFNVAKATAINMELLCDTETIAIPSSHLMGCIGYLDKETLVIPISNNGESLNTITAVKRAKSYGAKIISITSNSHSYLARLSDYIINTDCYQNQISSFISNYFMLSLLGIYLGGKIGYMNDLHISLALKMAEHLQGKTSAAIKANINTNIENDSIIISGFATDFGIACEMAQNFRKIAHKNAFCVPLEEITNNYEHILKNNTLLIIICTNAEFDTIIPSLEKINQLCDPIIYTTENIANDIKFCKNIIAVGDTLPLFNPITISSAIISTILGSIPNKNELSA